MIELLRGIRVLKWHKIMRLMKHTQKAMYLIYGEVVDILKLCCMTIMNSATEKAIIRNLTLTNHENQ